MMFSELKWMTFPERVLYQKATQMFKTIRGNASEYLIHLLLRLIFMQYLYVHHLASTILICSIVNVYVYRTEQNSTEGLFP